MRRFILPLLLLAASPAWAADGSLVAVSPPAGTSEAQQQGTPVVMKLCDTKTDATVADCGPVWVPVQNASSVTIKVVNAVNGGAACTFDNWGIYEMPTSTALSATNTFGALGAIDDDTTTTIVGATAGQELKLLGPVGPYIAVDAGTLGTCTNFSIWAWFYPPIKR